MLWMRESLEKHIRCLFTQLHAASLAMYACSLVSGPHVWKSIVSTTSKTTLVRLRFPSFRHQLCITCRRPPQGGAVAPHLNRRHTGAAIVVAAAAAACTCQTVAADDLQLNVGARDRNLVTLARCDEQTQLISAAVSRWCGTPSATVLMPVSYQVAVTSYRNQSTHCNAPLFSATDALRARGLLLLLLLRYCHYKRTERGHPLFSYVYR